MEIKKINCKSALSASRLPGLSYSLNPYRGCQHNCAYCYVPNVLRIKRDLWGDFIDVKTNIPIILSKELKKKKPGVVGLSTVTDPYQPIESKYKLTRYEIKYKDYNSKYMALFENSKLKIFERKEEKNNISYSVIDENIVISYEGGKAEHIIYEKSKKGTFWRLGNNEVNEFTYLPINVLNYWKNLYFKENIR